MQTEEQTLNVLANQVGDIIMGTVFVLFGLATASIAPQFDAGAAFES
ncbi:hypothetical protein GWN42_02500 [candidate division KSB1 bacterium]|nr:hypothetical protein [candidate division KSB1 bacterium]